MTDYRTRAGRTAEILAELEIGGGTLSIGWLEQNRLRPAALRRLIAAGTLEHLPCKHPSVLRLGIVRTV